PPRFLAKCFAQVGDSLIWMQLPRVGIEQERAGNLQKVGMVASDTQDGINLCVREVDVGPNQRLRDKVQGVIFREESHVDIGKDIEERRRANCLGVAEFNQLATAGGDERQMMMDCQTPQAIEESSIKVGILS